MTDSKEVVEAFLTHVCGQGPIKDQTATEDEAEAYYELDAPIVDALVGFLKTLGTEDTDMKRDHPAWANIVAGCFKEVHAWHTAIAWASELKSEPLPDGFPTTLSTIWGDREVVVYITKGDHSPAAVFYGDEVRARGLEFLTRDRRDERVKVLSVFNEVY